jgi:hypothetical protein
LYTEADFDLVIPYRPSHETHETHAIENNNDISFPEAIGDPEWLAAMQDEMHSITKNGTWDLVPLPPGITPITAKWVFKLKQGLPGQQEQKKARLVARGFEQKAGIDYSETFAPVIKWSTTRAITSLAASQNWKIHHLDVKTAFLNGELKEVYMYQPTGFQAKGKETLVCKLKKSLYGLKQSPRAWYERIDSELRQQGLLRSHSDYSLYFSNNQGKLLILILYDLFITGNDLERIETLKQHLQEQFEMTDLGQVRKYLGVRFQKCKEDIFLNQSEYATHMLQEFGMANSKGSSTPLPEALKLTSDMEAPPVDATLYCQMVGKLIYLTHTRPDLAFSVSIVSRYMSVPQQPHLDAVRHIFRYINNTKQYGILYPRSNTSTITGFIDADWGADIETRRSTGGYLFMMGLGPITWQSKRQDPVSRSSTESEYRALSDGAQEAVWIKRLFSELGNDTQAIKMQAHDQRMLEELHRGGSLQILCDNQGSIRLAKNPIYHARTKHIEIHHHFIRERVLEGEISLDYIPTDQQPADILTKSLGKHKFEQHR